MKVMLLLLILSEVEAKSPSKRDCLQLFNAKNHAEVIRQCETIAKETVEMEFIYFASLMFMDISYKRINHIFYNGKQMGSFVYKYRTGKNLYTNLEKYHLKNYFPQLIEFADQGVLIAQLLTAKVFFINVGIMKRDEMAESTPDKYDELDKGMQKYYLPNLEKIVAKKPDHVEALALLGIESYYTEYIEGQYGSDTQYYSIKDERLYAHLLWAHQLGHPGLQKIIDGVAAWNRHIKGLTEQANNQDVEALFKLGQNAYSKSHDDKQYLDEAFNFYKQAADLGHVDALRAVNRFYASERYDPDKYLSTLQQLIDLDDTKAMIRLGDIYLCNDQTAKAKALYEQAVALNDPIAPYALDDLKFDGEPSAGCRNRK